ncbi:MAG: PHB depolymerase family esterase [Pseudomonadota bacterium]
MSGTPAFACSTTTPCAVETGEYYIQKPESVAEEKSAAVVFIHGFGNSGPAVFRNTGMVTSFLDRGYIVAAPNGLRMTGRNGGSWSFHPDGRKARDEIGFITSIRDDLIANHNVDPDRIILAGFSIGGSMTAYLACAVPEAFPAYAPLAGNFWRPHPESCKGPVRMLHTHGWRDGTVPLEGRVLRGTGLDDPNAVIQGDVFHALTIWRAANGCEQLKADRYETEGFFLRRSWDRCAPGSALEFALFDGGHSVPQAWPDLVMDWFEDLSESSD